ncbi:PilZ domain-containing protein [Thioalkalivibrio sp. ALJ1]|uniref:PilZ domain-containing protein n=1 Tax=Thioalkalivibrio sp. ALJ1 TaxID=1158144 RepID=UPI00056E3D23|nr:PilZ domain-containing protein [Thioalkalivibrio sp. ALJ1]
MELREGRRRAVSMAAEVEDLTCALAYQATGRVRNVSLSGLYLELPVSGLTKHSPLRLVVRPEGNGGGRAYVWDCIVMRLDERGAGAMFEAENPSDVDGLLDLLRARMRHSPRRAH